MLKYINDARAHERKKKVGVIIVCKFTKNLYVLMAGGGWTRGALRAAVCARALPKLPVFTRLCTKLQTGMITHDQQITRFSYKPTS